MGNRGANSPGRSAPGGAPEPADHPLVPAFHALRDELVSTLVYLLGNRDDALDAAQETFLKCWRDLESFASVQNVRAWIFRVGMNTDWDHQLSAWSRRVKPLLADALLPPARDDTPGA